MKYSIRFSFRHCALLASGTLALGALATDAPGVWAQVAAIRPAGPGAGVAITNAPPAALPAPLPPLPAAPGTAGTSPVAGAATPGGVLPGTGAVQAADAGINVLIIPIDPASGVGRVSSLDGFNGAPSRVITRVLAAKVPKQEPFTLDPDQVAAFPPKPKPGAAVPPAVTPLPAPVEPLPPNLVPGGGVRLSDVPDVVGAAEASAAPLRRALVRSGYFDVLSAAPDGAAIRRAINERRLSQRALDRVQDAIQILAASMQTTANTAAPNPDNQARNLAAQEEGVAAASQIGQALGYRSVILLSVLPNAVPADAPAMSKISSTYAMLLVDSQRENGELLAFDEGGPDVLTANESAASTGALLLNKKLDMWPAVTPSDRAARASDYLQRARTFVTQHDNDSATEALNQSLALDPTQRDAQVLLGDILLATDPMGAAAAYRRAIDSGAAQPGRTWEKTATAYAAAKDWPRTLDAGRRALANGWDSATLRMAMATAQFGRSDLFRKADRLDSADDAETEARHHLDRARELSPDDPKITRLLAEQLNTQGRVREAAESLDKLMAITEQPDLDLLTLYANVLTDRGGRDVDAFQAWARVWRQSGVSVAPMTAIRYRHVAEGFDQYVSDTARQAAQLSTGVANGTVPRESALLQLQKLSEDMKSAESAIKILQPPAGATSEANHASRMFAATNIVQAVNAHRVYVETGDEIYRGRAAELHRQAIMQLNIARGAKTVAASPAQ